MAHAQISVTPYGGTDAEDFAQFEQLFNGFIGVAGVAPLQQANFLQLHLRDHALRFYQTLPAATRENVANSLTALRDHFSNPQLQEVHVLKLEQTKFDLKKDTPENFLVTLQKKAEKAYPTPEIAIPNPIDAGAADAALEAARHARETAQRDERLDAVRENRDEQVRRLFYKSHAQLASRQTNGSPCGRNSTRIVYIYKETNDHTRSLPKRRLSRGWIQ